MDRGGITPLDLLAGITAVVLAVTVLVPWARVAHARYVADDAADDVAAAMAEAQQLATLRSRPVKLMVDEAADSVEVEGGHFRRLPAAVRISGPPRGADGKGVAIFRPNGRSDAPQVLVTGRGIAWALSYDPASGQVRRVIALAR
jgi:hypothetical protein